MAEHYFQQNVAPNYMNSTQPYWYSEPGKGNSRSDTSGNKTEFFHQADFYPIETMVIICFLVLIIMTTIISRLAFATMDKKCENKYDLIIFKALHQAKGSVFVGRKMFDNNVVIQHNVKAALEAGFDINRLNSSKAMVIKPASTFIQ